MSRILTEEQQLVREAVRDFAVNEVRPAFLEYDMKNEFPRELNKRCGELGFIGADVPEEYGGSGLDLTSSLMILEEISKEMPALGCSLMVSMTLPLFFVCGNNPEHKKLIAELISGEKIGAIAQTDPAGVINTSEWPTLAKKVGNEYVLNGTKLFVTNGEVADYFMVSGPCGGKHCDFLVKRGAEGFSTGIAEKKMGMNGAGNASISMRDVHIPLSDKITLVRMTNNLAAGYLHMSAVALGCMEGAYEKTRAYMRVRSIGGRPAIEMQAVSSAFARLKTKIEAARSFINDAATLVEAGKADGNLIRMVKVFVTDTSVDVCRECVQLYGGLGYCEETGIAHYLRDAMGTTIGDLTAPIQYDLIAKALAKADKKKK